MENGFTSSDAVNFAVKIVPNTLAGQGQTPFLKKPEIAVASKGKIHIIAPPPPIRRLAQRR